MARASEELGRVDLHALPPAATKATLAAAQLGIDVREIDGEATGQAGDDGEQARAVRFASGLIVEGCHGRTEGIAGGNRICEGLENGPVRWWIEYFNG